MISRNDTIRHPAEEDALLPGDRETTGVGRALPGPVGTAALGPEVPLARYDHPYRLRLRQWLAENAPAEPEPLEYGARLSHRRDWQRRLADGGWAGPSWPREYGGHGAGPLEQFMYYEELALARAPGVLNPHGLLLPR